ncbi:hypothetical protein [Methylosinus sp. LW4]|uniref:hypothetical protein n=1 Tax=Methylosinus sp. LW4 TaxID=136993 RepID=UPI0018DEDDBE|nr:hypothetical protein [Methylosinus sp. LW4]
MIPSIVTELFGVGALSAAGPLSASPGRAARNGESEALALSFRGAATAPISIGGKVSSLFAGTAEAASASSETPYNRDSVSERSGISRFIFISPALGPAHIIYVVILYIQNRGRVHDGRAFFQKL